ncbi:MAG: RlmE family RNA methyltransferase [Anaerolineae bacterium]|nr:RlmE family RNA methyltransferase [Anaerolineae bacterium]
MSRKPHWRTQQQRDPFFQKAKADGYRARSAYKLLQIQEKFKVIRPGNVVVDLGAAPGSWSQVAVQIVGPKGRVVAVDIQPLSPLDGVIILQGDMTALEVQDCIVETVGGPADVVMCDAAPFTTGIKLRDHVLSMDLARAALAVAKELLKPGGSLVIKVFQGEDLPGVIHDVKMAFHPVKVFKPPASRKESWEQFIVARGYKANAS